MPIRPLRRLCALGGALLLGTLGLGVTGAAADPSPPPEKPGIGAAPADGTPTIPDALDAAPVQVIVLLRDQPTQLSLAAEKDRLRTQQQLLEDWSSTYGLQVDRQFGYLVNGFSATVPGDRLADLSLEPEVLSVRRERIYERTEHTARDTHGVPTAFGQHDVDGTGMVVSIIDSGLDPSHPAMRLDDCGAAAIQRINPAADAGFTCKIPDGYNYADESYEITDAVVDAHGQHVAGIVGANGSPGEQPGDFATTGELDGVAPNAQLLAMKVFSNSGGGAKDSDIVAAIEDSVKLDADVINMSLGSPNGHKNASDATSLAIEAAREAGVLTVIAAGNDGQNFSPSGSADDALGLLDDGTVGAPGTQGSALTVASLDNAAITQLMAYVNDDPEGIPYSPATGEYDGEPHPLVDIGLAKPADVEGKDLSGSYALIQRGEIAFSEKYANAIAAGAEGVVVYNTEDAPFGMAGVEDQTLPGITLTGPVGEALAARVAAGPTTIRITDEVGVLPGADGLAASSFTSWGTTPTLDFEPEIAGIGGNVYSTYNDGTYGTSSGTSMASPNVAGLSALLLEHLAETRPEVTGAERVDLATVMLMNTAQVPVEESGVPTSPRRVGAGLARIDLALDSQVIATVDGAGAAALREMDGPQTFTVTLTSTGSEDLRFTLPQVDVIAETNEPGAATTTRVSGGSVSTPDTVTVPAGGTATVEVTVTPESTDPHFLGGWVLFEAADAQQPDLRVPFLGFAGEWNAEPILLPAGEDLADLGVQTELLTSWAGQTLPLRSEMGEFWLSPNGDGDMDTIAANLMLLRNAAEARYTVLDASGEEVTVIGEEQDLRRPLLGDFAAVEDPRALQWTGYTFDGITWDAQEADFVALPDGRYTYRVSTRLSEDQPWQHVDLPFGIDATAPVIEFGAYEGGQLPFTVIEDGSGVLAAPTATDAAGQELPVTETPDGGYVIEVEAQQAPYVTVSVLDAGFNLGVGTQVFEPTTLIVDSAEQFAAAPIGPGSMLLQDGTLLLNGYVSSDIVEVRVGEEVVDSSNGRFRVGVPLREGEQEILVEGLGADGQVLQEQSVTVTYDSTAPVLEITALETDTDGGAMISDDGTVTIGGTVTDEREGAELTVSAGDQTVEVGPDGSFEITVTPAEDAAAITLVASDGVNKDATAIPLSGRTPAQTWEMPTFEGVEFLPEVGAMFVPGDTPDIDASGEVLTLHGTLPGGGTLTLTPGNRVGEDGSYRDPAPIPAQIAEDGSFTVDVPVATGENHVRMVITDADGTVRYDRGVAIYVDVVAPSLTVEEPTLVGGTLYTNAPDVHFVGTASDDGWGYALRLNDSTVVERMDFSSPGEISNRREFSTDLTVADGDTLLLQFSDANGNVLVGLIPVVLDQDAPTVEIEGVQDSEVLEDRPELEIAAQDPHLASLQVMVDGTVVHEAVTELATTEHSVEDALVDVRDLEPEDAADTGEAADGEAEAAAAAPAEDAPAETTAPENEAPAAIFRASGARTAVAQEVLEATVATADLASGEHVLTVVATDLAGNTTTEARAFTLREVLELSGPETVELTIDRELLGDQAALAEQVLEEFTATLDGSAKAADEAGVQIRLVPGSVLRDGKQTVTVLATRPDGGTVEAEVTVSIELKVRTLRDGDVTATSTFRSDDALTARIESAEGGGRVLTLSTLHAPLTAQITVPGQKGERVLRILADGTRIPVRSTLKDGTLVFEGPSNGTYLLLPPGAPSDSGPQQPGAPGQNPGPGAGGPGSGPGAGDQAPGRSGGPLVRTGTEALIPLLAGVSLLLAGAGLLVARRRR